MKLGHKTSDFSPRFRYPTSDIVGIMDINKKQSALQSLKEERMHIEEYLHNAVVKKKELDKELFISSAKVQRIRFS